MNQPEAHIRQAQTVESMATIIDAVAHSIDNLLTPVLINVGELLNSFPQDSEDREIVEEIAAASKRASDMIRQLALQGRANRSPHCPVDLQDLIADAVSELRETFDRPFAIETDIAPEPAVATGNAAELKRALMALCFNAVEAMPTGGVLTISLSRMAETASTIEESGMAITVSDTGAGVPPEIRDRVFEPFFTTKPIASHAGLGLTTACSTMRHHGGRAELDETETGRTSFVLRFPPSMAPEHAACQLAAFNNASISSSISCKATTRHSGQ